MLEAKIGPVAQFNDLGYPRLKNSFKMHC